MKYSWLKPISEDAVKRLARIFGPQSAAQQCLDHAAQHRAEGDGAEFFEARQPGVRDGYLIVKRLPKLCEATEESEK